MGISCQAGQGLGKSVGVDVADTIAGCVAVAGAAGVDVLTRGGRVVTGD